MFVNEPQTQDALFDLILFMPPSHITIFVNNKKAVGVLYTYSVERDQKDIASCSHLNIAWQI